MKNQTDFTIDQQDLKILFVYTKDAYRGYTFELWCNEIKKSYTSFIKDKVNPKTFSQWVNGQIIYLTTYNF